MAGQSKDGATPKLRFPEFRGTSAWGATPLDRLAERVTTKNTAGKVSRVLTNSAEFGVLDQRNYFDKDIATAGHVSGYYIVEKGDYVYNPRTSASAPVGPISRNDVGEGVMSPLYTVFRFGAAHTDFYEQYFHSTGWHAYVRTVASTGARHDRMSITNDAFMNMPVPAPSQEERKKIADCLTSIDEVIAAQGRKVEALKAHKHGLMQQLFPRQGETRPRLRFPEFRNAREWNEGPVSAVILTVTPPKKIPTSGYHSSGALAIVDQSPEAVCGWTNDLNARIHAPLPLIVFGDHTCVLKLIEHDFAQGADGIKILAAKPCIDNRLLFYALQADPIVSTSYRRHFSLLQEKQIAFPQDTAEQHRIADCLASLDAQITAETTQLAALKTHKRGLMQQLFPVPESVS